jgi:hypothetical protein
VPARHPVKETVIGGQTVAVEPVKAAAEQRAPSKFAVYAKAIAAFLGAELVAISSWGMALGNDPITRVAWFGLAAAIAGPVLVAGGVAAIKNAKKPADDVGHVDVLTAVVVVLVVVVVLILVGVLPN